ncbi:MAG: ATP-dependent DNA helicase RecG, partial [Pedobacter sp.]
MLQQPIAYLKGVGPQRAELLQKELGIFTFGDLLQYFPFRHIDKTKITRAADISPDMDYVQLVGLIDELEIIGEKRAKRLVGRFRDSSGFVELTWFQGATWVQKAIQQQEYYRLDEN